MQLYDIFVIAAPYIGLGLSISLFIGVAFYMASKILADPVMENRGKEFFFSTMETIFIIIGFIIVSQSMDLIFSSLMGCTTTCSPITFAEISMGRILDMTTNLYFVSYLFDLFTGPFLQSVVSSGYGSFSMDTIQISFMPLIGLDIVMEFYYILLQKIVDIMIFVIARQGLLSITIPLVAYLFPIAVVLRSIPVTKSSGSSLLAIIFVLYYVFPMSVLFSDYLIFNVYKTDLVQQKNYNQDLTAQSTYLRSGETNKYQTIKTEAEIKEQAQVEETSVKSAIEGSPDEGLSIEDALQKISGAPLTSIRDKLHTLTFNTIASALSGWLLTFSKSSGILGLLAKVLGVVFYVAYIRTLLELISPFDWMADLFNALIIFTALIAQIAIIIFIPLIIEVVISITSYRAIAKFFRGDASLLGLTKVI